MVRKGRGKYTKLDLEQGNGIKEGRVFAQICDKGRETDRNIERRREFFNTGGCGNDGAKKDTVDNQRRKTRGEWNSLDARPNVEAHERSDQRNVRRVR